MKLLLTSDTHYGHSAKTHQIHEKFLAKLAEEVARHNVQAVIHAGDWSSSRQDQLYRTMKMFRNALPGIPIVTSLGNHDLWQVGKNKYSRMLMHGHLLEQHKAWFKELDIHHLEQGPFIIDDVIIMGFDGWYKLTNPPTNDADRMVSNIEGVPAMVYLAGQTYKKLDNILQQDISQYRASVMVTHHPPFTEDNDYLDYCANTNYFQPIKDKFDAFCTGHSHHYWNEVQDGCQILNSGSNYDKPKYLIFDV